MEVIMIWFWGFSGTLTLILQDPGDNEGLCIRDQCNVSTSFYHSFCLVLSIDDLIKALSITVYVCSFLTMVEFRSSISRLHTNGHDPDWFRRIHVPEIWRWLTLLYSSKASYFIVVRALILNSKWAHRFQQIDHKNIMRVQVNLFVVDGYYDELTVSNTSS